MTTHHLDPMTGTVTDVFSPGRAPVLSVEPGDTVVVRTLDACGYLEPLTDLAEGAASLIPGSSGHCLAGPIDVRGAEPGQVLAVHLESLQPAGWGWTVAGARDVPLTRRLGLAGGQVSLLAWQIDAATGTARSDRGHTVRTAPFLGVIGLPPAEPGEHSTVPPRTVGGGNIDCRELVAGSVLYLPVTVPGALLCLGDGHAAQGDGEVAGTAIECGMTTTLRVELGAAPPVPGVHADTPAGRLTFGFSPDLNEAMADALDGMLCWLQALYGLDKPTALALASPTVDLRVTQVANDTWGVHAVLPHDAIR